MYDWKPPEPRIAPTRHWLQVPTFRAPATGYLAAGTNHCGRCVWFKRDTECPQIGGVKEPLTRACIWGQRAKTFEEALIDLTYSINKLTWEVEGRPDDEIPF